nr:uncharacterized protein LOC109160503 [Ipomoea batatas]
MLIDEEPWQDCYDGGINGDIPKGGAGENCQGATSKKFLRAAHSLIRQHRPVCFCILETKISGNGADEICLKLDFDNWIRVEAVGMSGGIWVFWNDSLKAKVLRTNPQFILMEIENVDNTKWNMALVYESPNLALRRKLWNALNTTECNIMVPWMAMGDFNAVMNIDEVSSTNTFNDNRSKDYNMWINEEGLIDLGFNRPCFTWKRGSDMNTFRTVRGRHAVLVRRAGKDDGRDHAADELRPSLTEGSVPPCRPWPCTAGVRRHRCHLEYAERGGRGCSSSVARRRKQRRGKEESRCCFAVRSQRRTRASIARRSATLVEFITDLHWFCSASSFSQPAGSESLQLCRRERRAGAEVRPHAVPPSLVFTIDAATLS